MNRTPYVLMTGNPQFLGNWRRIQLNTCVKFTRTVVATSRESCGPVTFKAGDTVTYLGNPEGYLVLFSAHADKKSVCGLWASDPGVGECVESA